MASSWRHSSFVSAHHPSAELPKLQSPLTLHRFELMNLGLLSDRTKTYKSEVVP